MWSGLYRLRRADGAETDCIGQTGLRLVRRLGMLDGGTGQKCRIATRTSPRQDYGRSAIRPGAS